MQISPLSKKLQIKPGNQVLLMNAPEAFPVALSPLPIETKIGFKPDRTYDVVLLFVLNSADLRSNLENVQEALRADTIIWIAYPKKSSGIKSDLGMMLSWDEPLRYGYEPVASAAIDATWTALRFKKSDQIKKTAVSNAAIKNNEFSEFIDIQNKVVKLPSDVEEDLAENPQLLSFFEQLSYSHRKEYIVWILSAKQERTRQQRIGRMVEMLKAGKKNPAAK